VLVGVDNMEETEIYVLNNKRKISEIKKFLLLFIKERTLQGDIFCIPEFNCDNSKIIFYDEESILQYLINHPTEEYGLYWKNNKISNISTAMIFFTKDKNMILGLSVIENIEETLKELKNLCKSKYSYIAFEEVPPLNKKEFIERCKISN